MDTIASMLSSDRADALAAFLRARRVQLDPAAIGVAVGARRRTPGLRREEVATLADLSVSYYTRLEQGRGSAPSREVVEALARAMHLDEAARRHLHELARAPDTERSPREDPALPPAVVRLVASLDPRPAFVKGPCWDIISANQAAGALFGSWGGNRETPPNVLRWMFLDASARTVHIDWEGEARALLARFRLDQARHPSDGRFADLLEEVLAGSTAAQEWWPEHSVAEASSGIKLLFHPAVGELRLEHCALLVAEHPDHKIVVYTDPDHGDDRFTTILRAPG